MFSSLETVEPGFHTYSDLVSQLRVALPEESALIKVAVFFLGWFIVWLPIALATAMVVRWRPFQPIQVQQKIPLVASLYLLVPLLLWALAAVEAVPLANYGLVWSGASCYSLLLGLCTGVVGLVVLFGLQYRLGWLAWESSGAIGPGIVLPTLLLALLVGLMEEWVFRGFLLYQFQQDYAPWLAIVLSSLVFALLHLVWDWGEALPQLPGLWLMGLVLSLAYWVDGHRIALAWGLHTGWVWGIACLDTGKCLRYTGRVPTWVTGLAGKPLAGLMGLALLLLTGLVLWPLA